MNVKEKAKYQRVGGEKNDKRRGAHEKKSNSRGAE